MYLFSWFVFHEWIQNIALFDTISINIYEQAGAELCQAQAQNGLHAEARIN